MVSSDRLGLGENIVDGPLYECVMYSCCFLHLFLALSIHPITGPLHIIMPPNCPPPRALSPDPPRLA